jgi:AraC family transcriptional regulator, regulatory protein of adaptative response / DNA-3-methyladenine glycosylase II
MRLNYTDLMILDPKACYKALRAHDARFDGRFFIGVVTTGIYCRPVCTAGTAKFKNCEFYVSAAAAQSAGFRPCLRCRPETVVDLGAWNGTGNSVSRAISLISNGSLDTDESVVSLAEKLGVSDRHVRRLFQEHVGASPISILQTRRVLFAKQLVHETNLSMSDVAMASGFKSVRRFNEVFQGLFKRAPSSWRRAKATPDSSKLLTNVVVNLRYQAPFHWQHLLSHFQTRAISGIEEVTKNSYRRSVATGDSWGFIDVSHDAKTKSLVCKISIPEVKSLAPIVNQIRSMFDLNADAATIEKQLSADAKLKLLIRKRSGLRVPGAWSGFEVGVRTILGQQVSLEAGRKLTEQLAQLCGRSISNEFETLTLVFPNAQQVLSANLESMKMPGARKRALKSLAAASIENENLFEPKSELNQTIEGFLKVEGIGPWSAHYMSLRFSREPDAFPASDAALLRMARELKMISSKGGAAELEAQSRQWSPWRAYAAQHLWAAS